SPSSLGNYQLDYKLSVRKNRPAGVAQAAHRSLLVPAIALAQIPRRTALERFQLSCGIRFAIDSDNLQQGIHEHLQLGNHVDWNFRYHAATGLAAYAGFAWNCPLSCRCHLSLRTSDSA